MKQGLPTIFDNEFAVHYRDTEWEIESSIFRVIDTTLESKNQVPLLHIIIDRVNISIQYH